MKRARQTDPERSAPDAKRGAGRTSNSDVKFFKEHLGDLAETYLKWAAQHPEGEEDPPSEWERGVATKNANAHLHAYKVDRDPGHIFDAVAEYLRYELDLPPVMRRNLKRAIEERDKRPATKKKANTLRDVYLITEIAVRYGGRIPERVGGAFIEGFARRWKTTPAAIKMAISRVRRAILDPSYDRARAFLP